MWKFSGEHRWKFCGVLHLWRSLAETLSAGRWLGEPLSAERWLAVTLSAGRWLAETLSAGGWLDEADRWHLALAVLGAPVLASESRNFLFTKIQTVFLKVFFIWTVNGLRQTTSKKCKSFSNGNHFLHLAVMSNPRYYLRTFQLFRLHSEYPNSFLSNILLASHYPTHSESLPTRVKVKVKVEVKSLHNYIYPGKGKVSSRLHLPG